MSDALAVVIEEIRRFGRWVASFEFEHPSGDGEFRVGQDRDGKFEAGVTWEPSKTIEGVARPHIQRSMDRYSHTEVDDSE